MADNETITFKLEGEQIAQIVVQVDSVKFQEIKLDDISKVIIDAVQTQIYQVYSDKYAKDLTRLN